MQDDKDAGDVDFAMPDDQISGSLGSGSIIDDDEDVKKDDVK